MNWSRYGTDFIAANDPEATTGFWGRGFKRAPEKELNRPYTVAAGRSRHLGVLGHLPCTATTATRRHPGATAKRLSLG